MSDDAEKSVNDLLKAAYHENPTEAFGALADEFTERAENCHKQLEAIEDPDEYDDYTKGSLDAFRSAAVAARMCEVTRKYADRNEPHEDDDE